VHALCVWCYDKDDDLHRRFVTIARLKEYRRAYGLPEDEDDEDIPTSPESRQALQKPPSLEDEKIPDTDPAPGFKPPIKREDD
jgi:hypothetical protein